MTKLITLDKWVDTILGRLNGAQPDMVRTEVNNAVREFFKESTVWRQDMFLTLREGVPTYDLNGLIPSADPLYVHEAYYEERTLNPVEKFPFGWQDKGAPHSYWSPEPGLVRFSPIPTGEGEGLQDVRLRISLRPNACRVPSWVESHFFGAIVDGSLSRIYFHPKRPYTSPSLGDIHSRRFRSQIASARSQAARRFTSAKHSYRFPQGWSPVV